MSYLPNSERYSNMKYNRVGKSGLLLPAISLGLWNNFGGIDVFENSREMVLKSFDMGITHFDLANNYGPPAGSAEETFGKILKDDLKKYRDELVISTKAGWGMWPGPYGDNGSKKYLVASLDQSLLRMGLDYVDIFYHHRPDPNTPLEETLGALDLIVRQGKALYVGISSYSAEMTKEASTILKRLGTPCLIHQPYYNMFDRSIENGLQEVLEEEGIGSIAFCPLAQGLLTPKYLKGVPADSRLAKKGGFISQDDVSEVKINKVKKLQEIAAGRGQSINQMALAWTLRDGHVTSALIGASKVGQIVENVKALDNLDWSKEELVKIDDILA